ncbi:MAG: response regulator [Desulfobacteraceae bacterium]|jgi:CheY-like chemotaxis protein
MRILIIDDEIAALTKMKILLTPYGKCTLCTNGVQALKIYSKAIDDQQPFDLITIDIHLGEVNGNELLGQIIQLETDKNVPVVKKIMVTASGTAENLVTAYGKGCDAFLVKPIKRDALDQKMSALGYTKQE